MLEEAGLELHAHRPEALRVRLAEGHAREQVALRGLEVALYAERARGALVRLGDAPLGGAERALTDGRALVLVVEVDGVERLVEAALQHGEEQRAAAHHVVPNRGAVLGAARVAARPRARERGDGVSRDPAAGTRRCEQRSLQHVEQLVGLGEQLQLFQLLFTAGGVKQRCPHLGEQLQLLQLLESNHRRARVQRGPAADKGLDAAGQERPSAVLAAGGEPIEDEESAEAGIEQQAAVADGVRSTRLAGPARRPLRPLLDPAPPALPRGALLCPAHQQHPHPRLVRALAPCPEPVTARLHQRLRRRAQLAPPPESEQARAPPSLGELQLFRRRRGAGLAQAAARPLEQPQRLERVAARLGGERVAQLGHAGNLRRQAYSGRATAGEAPPSARAGVLAAAAPRTTSSSASWR